MFVILAITGYSLLGVVALLDKFILSKKVSHPLTYTFYIAVPFLLLFLALPFGVVWPTTGLTWLAGLGGGMFFLIGLWLMFMGVQKGAVSHIGPLIGATVPLFTIILSRLFLGEILSVNKILGIGFLIAGSLFISIEKKRKHHGVDAGIWWGVLAGLFFAVSFVASKYIYDELGFFSGLIWSRGMLGLGGLILLLFPIVRSEVWSKNSSKAKTKSNLGVIVANMSLSVVGVFLIQYAVSIGSVSVVSAFEGLKYAILIILVALLSKFFPKILKENYSRGEMAREVLAIFLIGVGLILLI